MPKFHEISCACAHPQISKKNSRNSDPQLAKAAATAGGSWATVVGAKAAGVSKGARGLAGRAHSTGLSTMGARAAGGRR